MIVHNLEVGKTLKKLEYILNTLVKNGFVLKNT